MKGGRDIRYVGSWGCLVLYLEGQLCHPFEDRRRSAAEGNGVEGKGSPN